MKQVKAEPIFNSTAELRVVKVTEHKDVNTQEVYFNFEIELHRGASITKIFEARNPVHQLFTLVSMCCKRFKKPGSFKWELAPLEFRNPEGKKLLFNLLPDQWKESLKPFVKGV